MDSQLRVLAECLLKGLHKAAFEMVQPFPYGRWTCANGRQVIFDREYRAMWQRLPNGRVCDVDPCDLVEWCREEFFFDDGLPQYRQYGAMRRLRNILVQEWRMWRVVNH